MPFQMRDETAGRDLLYIDNLGQVGLGSMPTSGQAVTVQGLSLIDSGANFGANLFRPGVQAPYEGTVNVPAGSSVDISISVPQLPTATATLPATAASTTRITFYNSNSISVNNYYSIW